MVSSHIVLVVAACLLQSPCGNCANFVSRFNDLTRFATENGGYVYSAEARQRLVDLKQEMVRACRDGLLRQLPETRYIGVTQVGGVTTRAYHMSIRQSTEDENFVLPYVDCRETVGHLTIHNSGNDKRSLLFPGERTAPSLLPTSQGQKTERIQPNWWSLLGTTFELIKRDALQNNGYLSTSSSLAMDYLKRDMMKYCDSGELAGVGPGENIKGPVGEVTIATKVYVLTSDPTCVAKTLPSIDCQANIIILAELEKDRRMALGERASPIISSPYSPSRSLYSSTSGSGQDLQRVGLMNQDHPAKISGFV